MALPKVDTPLFTATIPSMGEVEYRPFLVKEEKILLIARESGDRRDITRAIKQIINNCVMNENFDVNEIPLYEMEYLFIKLRSVSISNIVKARVTDSDDNKDYDIEVDLDEIEIKGEEPDPKIELNDSGFVVKMINPKSSIVDKIKPVNSMTELTFETIKNSIECIFDRDDVYLWSEASEKERDEWMDSLSVDDYGKLNEYVDSIPKIEHVVTYKNSKGTEKRVVFRNLDDFFIWA